MPEHLDALTHRLDRLARENRWYRRGGALALFLVGAALLMGQAAPPGPAEEVRAKRFILVDGAGMSRGAVTVGPDGTALLILADGQRRPRLSLTVAGNVAELVNTRNSGQASAEIWTGGR